MTKRKRRDWLQNLGLLAATVVGFFVIVEILLRITGIDSGRPRTPPIYAKSADAELSYELLPNLKETAFRSTVLTDRRGFRSPEIHPGKPTVAILGDSIAFGYGLENPDTLGGKLQSLVGDTMNVVTAAAPGYTIGQEVAMYTEKVELLHPGTLILVFYWNDLDDFEPAVLDDDGNLQAPGWIPGQPTCHPIEDGILGALPGRCWLDLHSAFYRTIKKVIVAKTEQGNLAEQEVQYRADAFGSQVPEDKLTMYETKFSQFAATLPKSMKKLFVIWPEKQLHLTETKELAAMAEKYNFETLNLYEVFGNRPESLDWDTVHPSAKTVAEAAGVLKSAMEEWKLMPDALVKDD